MLFDVVQEELQTEFDTHLVRPVAMVCVDWLPLVRVETQDEKQFQLGGTISRLSSSKSQRELLSTDRRTGLKLCGFRGTNETASLKHGHRGSAFNEFHSCPAIGLLPITNGKLDFGHGTPWLFCASSLAFVTRRVLWSLKLRFGIRFAVVRKCMVTCLL